MKMTIGEAMEAISRGETPEQYAKRIRRLRRLCNERDDLEDALSVLREDDRYMDRVAKKEKRLQKVLSEISLLG